MAHNTLAPWAEAVAGVPYPLTIDDLLTRPDDGWTYELVEGRLVKMPPSGFGASSMGVTLSAALYLYTRTHNLGRVSGADGEYVLSGPGEPVTAFAPDIAFVRAERLPLRESPEWDRPWQLAPDLAVEIASPNQFRPEMAEKAQRYLVAGVRLVWVIWPKQRQVDVWHLDTQQAMTTLGIGQSLDGLDVVPGFSYAIADLFT
ncbi:MAG: hypothetical protein OJF49_004333 [Ktedonobacterales bacterium]|jgi:Uma2 family endonuclease|nr:MAG: hypothetical protein OJF49_004333 [Ktedonobacterales bacterium]